MKLLTTVFVSLQVKAHRAGVDQPFTQPLMEMNRKEWLRRHFCFQRSGALQSLQPLGPDVRKLQRQLVCRSPRSLRRIFITLVSPCVHAYERAWEGQRTTQIQSIRSHAPHWKLGLSLTWSSLSRRGCLGNLHLPSVPRYTWLFWHGFWGSNRSPHAYDDKSCTNFPAARNS